MRSVVTNDKGGVSVDFIVKPDSEGCLCPSGLSVNVELTDQNIVDRDTCVPTMSLEVLEKCEIPHHESLDVPPMERLHVLSEGQEEGQYDHELFSCYDECENWDDQYLGWSDSTDSCVGSMGASVLNNSMVVDHSIVSELCSGSCSHKLEGCEVQLNRCAFYRELYMSG